LVLFDEIFIVGAPSAARLDHLPPASRWIAETGVHVAVAAHGLLRELDACGTEAWSVCRHRFSETAIVRSGRYVTEGTSERSQTFPARVEGNLGYGPIGIAEQRRSPLYTPGEQVAMRRYAEGLLERSREMGLGD
jgi:hypothetical protein